MEWFTLRTVKSVTCIVKWLWPVELVYLVAQLIKYSTWLIQIVEFESVAIINLATILYSKLRCMNLDSNIACPLPMSIILDTVLYLFVEPCWILLNTL